MSKIAHILCVSAGFDEGAYRPKTGTCSLDPASSLSQAIKGDLWVGPRQRLEALKPEKQAGVPPYLQIIPYYLFRNKGQYLRYVRTTAGGDHRLHGKVSIGIGGHIDLKDVITNDEGVIDLEATLIQAGKREAEEEVGIVIQDSAFHFVATIYATDTAVDSVHLGIVGVYDLSDEEVAALKINEEISDAAFRTLAEVRAETHADPDKELETWSRLVIDSNPLA